MLRDDSIMPWGVHKGKEMQDVPAKYLLWLHEENKCSDDIKEYIIDNLDAIKKEIKDGSN